MKDNEKQQCVICHKDITNELPKIDIYENHYCKDCYVEKCKYEFMKRELQYLEEQTQKHTRKETAEKIYYKAEKKAHFKDGGYYDKDRYYLDMEDLKEILKQFGVEIKE